MLHTTLEDIQQQEMFNAMCSMYGRRRFSNFVQLRIIEKDMSDPLLGYPLYRATDELGDVGHGDKDLWLDD